MKRRDFLKKTAITAVSLSGPLSIVPPPRHGPAAGASPSLEWPALTAEHKPWTRWWWMGSSVSEEGLTAAMETYERAGLGGLEITPIYGVKGYEDQFIDYLSPAWMNRLGHTLREAERLSLGIDMATGTGWPFGGPWVDDADASKYVAYKTYEVEGGERLAETVSYRQEPMVHAVNRQVDVSELVEPISENDHLQALALTQVRFPRPLPLQALMAYSEAGDTLDLTDKVDEDGQLDWTAPPGNWTLYAVFQGEHGKMVERAAPGGEGLVIDHFSQAAIQRYLQRFDQAFPGHDTSAIRAFFNDSYEVDDASGQASWTPNLFEAFEERRGYDLRDHLPALFGNDTTDNNRRVRCDYRETISDLLLEHFTASWQQWAHGKDALIRNQAHGSPANILDLYAASDIPETEGSDLLNIKFASSAAHVTGKQLVSSESATWLNEHFLSSLADVKRAVDLFFLGGVNHIFYHGTCYSPQDEDWPGWLFYAAVHFQPTNPFWHDFAALNRYIARVQSFLQAGTPENDVLLYFPIYDAYSDLGEVGLLRHFDGVDAAFDGSAFEAVAETLQERGYAFDFISDRQVQAVNVADQRLRAGDGSYMTLVLPESAFLPLRTFEKLIELVRSGATVVIYRSLPKDVPGLHDLETRRAAFQQLIHRIHFTETQADGIREGRLGRGRFLLGDDLEHVLAYASVRREAMVDEGLQFVRRRHAGGSTYFITNQGEEPVDGWVPVQTRAASVALFDPMTEEIGRADVREGDGSVTVYLQLATGASMLLQTFDAAVEGTSSAYHRVAGAPQPLAGTWSIRFLEGGPEQPPDVQTPHLGSWTDLGGEASKAFSGRAWYTLSFPRPEGRADAWLLDLGRVAESAHVWLNRQDLGALIGPTYRMRIDANLLRAHNTLEVIVSNLMANRIADMDRRDVPYKKFYNVNFPARLGENRNEKGLFDASDWSPQASGLLGPVTLTPIALF